MGRERELAEIISATGINLPSADTFQVSGVSRIANTYLDVPSGATGSRPGTPSVGMVYFNTTTDNLEQYTTGGWAAIEQAPTVDSIIPTTSTVTGTSITVTGAGFKTGCTVDLIGTDGVALSPASVSITNATTIVITTPVLSAANGPYDVKVISPGGLAGQLTDGLDAGGTPTWTTASGSLGSIRDNATGTHFTLVAVDPDGGAITYAETTSALAGGGFTLNVSTGAITGDPTDVATGTDYNFTVSATDPSGNAVSRSFIITVTPSYHLLASSSIGGETQFYYGDVLNTQQTTTFTLQAIDGNVAFVTKAWGGGGGGAINAPAIGGGGGYATGTYTLNENDYIFIQTGGGGDGRGIGTSGGAGGGGNTQGSGAGAGGGYSGFFTGQSAVHGSSVLLAGGGGGASIYENYGGFGGGTSGGQGLPLGGGGGSQSAGGNAVSNPQAGGASQAGSALQGGAGGPSGGHGEGGAGGGGYYGGGGGYGYSNNTESSPGGGGSGYLAPALSSTTLTGATAATGVPGNSADSARGTAGAGGPTVTSGNDGRIYITVA